MDAQVSTYKRVTIDGYRLLEAVQDVGRDRKAMQ
jgi:hypothetical protein